MARNNVVTGEKWQECDRCGFDFPKKERVSQDGLKVCPKCVDVKDHEDD